MENRRKSYRHPIAAFPGIIVRFQATDGAGTFYAEMVNLSVGGTCVKVNVNLPANIRTTQWIATFALTSEESRLNIAVDAVYLPASVPGKIGFQFLRKANPRDQEEQDQLISNFILGEQRTAISKSRAERHLGT